MDEYVTMSKNILKIVNIYLVFGLTLVEKDLELLKVQV